MRKILFLLAALIGGPVMMVTGYNEYQNSKKLVADGKSTTGFVVDGRETVRRKSRTHTYYLTVKYVPEGGQAVTKELVVSRALYDQGAATRSVKVNYLPSNPQIAQFGDKVEVKTTGMYIGGAFLIGGVGFLAFCLVSRSRNDEYVPSASSGVDELKKAA